MRETSALFQHPRDFTVDVVDVDEHGGAVLDAADAANDLIYPSGVDVLLGFDRKALLRRLGADHVLDYRQTDYTATGDHYDFVLDFEVHRRLTHCRRALAPSGRLTIVGGELRRIAAALPYGLLVRLVSKQRIDELLHRPNRELSALGALAAEGALTPVIERQYSLAETPAAMRRICDGLVVGQAVIVID